MSQKVTFEQLRRGAELPSLADCLRMENRMVRPPQPSVCLFIASRCLTDWRWGAAAPAVLCRCWGRLYCPAN